MGKQINTAASREVLHISCNTGTRTLPDMFALALGRRVCTSGNALIPVLQLLHVDGQ